MRWGPVRNGIADIAGIPKRALDHFSQRRRQITDRMAQVGSSSAYTAQIATWATREAKDTTVPYAALREDWKRRASAIGLDDAKLAAVCDGTARQRPAPADIDVGHLHARLGAPDGLTQHRATFDRRDAIRQVCAELPSGARAAQSSGSPISTSPPIAWSPCARSSRIAFAGPMAGVRRSRPTRSDGPPTTCSVSNSD